MYPRSTPTTTCTINLGPNYTLDMIYPNQPAFFFQNILLTYVKGKGTVQINILYIILFWLEDIFIQKYDVVYV